MNFHKKSAQFVNDRSLGEKNGKSIGLRLSIAVKNVEGTKA